MNTTVENTEDTQPKVIQNMIRWLQKNGKFITLTPSSRVLFHIHKDRVSGEVTLVTKEEHE